MPNDDNKILKYNYAENSLKVPAIIYSDLECLLEKMHSCQNNLKKSSTEKKLSSSMKWSDLRQPLFMTFKGQAISILKISIYPFYIFKTMLKNNENNNNK